MNIPQAAWFKSSHSDEQGGSCVEIANLTPAHALVAVRDSKLPDGPALALPPEAFAAFVRHVGRGRRYRADEGGDRP
ncbi:DUF397 domain-containing protein [Streptomyces sp. NPDC094038]|uniref:DUF397 domain-containing protein n=1 Tax=Streptomyces sp. NPDC094038 TaxID=3366055 RepID=UPI0037FD632B